MSKILIAYYSRADENYFGGAMRYVKVGNTEIVCNIMKELLPADSFKIEMKNPYSPVYMTCIEEAKKDLRAKARPELVSLPDSIDGYDTVVLAYPNYWGTMPMAVFTGLSELLGHDADGGVHVPGGLRLRRKENPAPVHQRGQRHGRQRTGHQAHLPRRGREERTAHHGQQRSEFQGSRQALAVCKWPAVRRKQMDYEKGYVYELMNRGGPTDTRESYFKEAVEEMMRARTLCAKANAMMPDDPAYVGYLEEICDFGNRVKFGKGVFINHSAILSASGGIEFEDGSMAAPGLRIATINHDMNERHTRYTYGKVLVKKNAWLGMNVTICPGVTIGAYSVVAAGAVVTKDVPDYAVVGGVPARVIRYLDPKEQKE